MSQHDQVIDNANGLTFRNDINAALAALFSASSDTTEPTAKVPGQLWFDTSTPGTNLLKVRDQTNAFWITVYSAANEAYDEQMARLAAQENLLINGGFGVNQLGLGAIVGGVAVKFCDGWGISATPANASAQQMTIAGAPPSTKQIGPNRARVTVQTAKSSLAATDFVAVTQSVEGLTARHLAWGLAGGKPAMLRFGFKGPAGTYGISVYQLASPNNCYVTTFTVAAGEANTDKIVVLSIPAPPTGTLWDTSTAGVFSLRITLASGTTYQGAAGWGTTNLLTTSAQFNILSTTSNVVELFDVKLTSNPDGLTTDPGFAGWDTTKELLRCQRYLTYPVRVTAIFSAATSSVAWRILVPLPVPMRTAPTTTQVTAGTPASSSAPTVANNYPYAIEFVATPSATGQSGVTGYEFKADAQL